MPNLSSASLSPPLLLLVERLDANWEKYREELRRTRRDFANEYVHDLRVAIRRLIATLETGRAVVHRKSLKKSRRLLKSQLEAFDDLRETQVQLSIAEELQEDLPEIAAYRDFLRKRERRLIASLEKKIRDLHSAGLAGEVTRLRKALVTQDIPDAQVILWSAIDEAFALVIQRKAAIRVGDPVSLRQLRVAFREFRYAVESIHPLLPDPPADYLRRLHDYQTLMGEVQDLEVSLQMLAKYSDKAGAELPGVQQRLTEMQRARSDAFIQGAHAVDAFWRPVPQKKFPWQVRTRTPSPKTRESS